MCVNFKNSGKERAKAADTLADIVERGRTGKELSAEERAVFEEFESEWPAFASQQVLGTEEFVRHLVKNDLGTVENILGTIQDIKKMLSNRNNPDAKKAADFVKKAEQLYIDALEEIGAKYVNNKVIGANDEEEKEAEQNKITFEEFADNENIIWRNVDYNDAETKSRIMQETHNRMVSTGDIVIVPEETIQNVEESFPDLRGIKKKERIPVLKEYMNKLKSSIFMDAHVITSVYGNKSINNRVSKAKSEGRLLYTKEESTQGMAQVQYESDINVNSSNNRVTQNSNVINTFPEKSNNNRPKTIKSTLESDKFTKAMAEYFTEIKKDMKRINCDLPFNFFWEQLRQEIQINGIKDRPTLKSGG